MRVVLMSGSHPRHMYYADKIASTDTVVGMVVMRREDMEPEIPTGLSDDMQRLYKHHFDLRLTMEEKYFGTVNFQNLIHNIPTLQIDPAELNSQRVIDFIKERKADAIISYGPDLISNEIIDLVGGNAFNLHGGLSPYYKGAATMFWPFYFLEPNFVGTTFHYMVKKIDAGRIIHQTVPVLEHGDCMHEVSCKAIAAAASDVAHIVRLMDAGQCFEGEKQRGNGKLFLVKDWRPEHLKLIYETFDDKIVDYYLDGVINKDNNPKLIKAF